MLLLMTGLTPVRRLIVPFLGGMVRMVVSRDSVDYRVNQVFQSVLVVFVGVRLWRPSGRVFGRGYGLTGQVLRGIEGGAYVAVFCHPRERSQRPLLQRVGRRVFLNNVEMIMVTCHG